MFFFHRFLLVLSPFDRLYLTPRGMQNKSSTCLTTATMDISVFTTSSGCTGCMLFCFRRVCVIGIILAPYSSTQSMTQLYHSGCHELCLGDPRISFIVLGVLTLGTQTIIWHLNQLCDLLNFYLLPFHLILNQIS